ncbi:MAG TPA: hypothetical protein VFR76_03005 [Verrucomicrobiae bacterium]|nr:hypothetical protein [Verrucomicrobiae bacterium]
MSDNLSSRLPRVCPVVFLLCATAMAAGAGEIKLEAQLIWGTTNSVSPNPNHKAAQKDVERKLKEQPFKWKHYFEVNRVTLTVPDGELKGVPVSKSCSIQVKNLGRQKVEVTLIGKGKEAGKITQALPKGELLVVGGNAENATAWFVVLKQAE